jgi:single-strand DNA-binding protein
MDDINSVVLIGRLTRDAEIRYTSTGTAIATFTIANNRSKKSGDTWEQVAHFFDAVMMGKTAESVNRYLVKGKQVAVHGHLQQDRWEKDGQTHTRVKIFVVTLELLGGGTQGEGERPTQNIRSTPEYDPYAGGSEPFDDGVPF